MEFEVDGVGRIKLRRRVLFTPKYTDGGYTWVLRYVVDGMAGAVSVGFTAVEHRSQAPENPHGVAHSTAKQWGVGCVWIPQGFYVHAYRAWPTGEDGKVMEACDLLDGNACYSQELEGLSMDSSGAALRRLANPDGEAGIWAMLEAAYQIELCPPLPQAVQERLAQVDAYEQALARVDEPPVSATTTS